MATQRWNQSTGAWEPYDSPYSSTVDSRLKALENGQTQNWNFAPNPSLEQWTTSQVPTNWNINWFTGTAGNQTIAQSATARTGSWSWSASYNTSAALNDLRWLQSDGMPLMPGQWWEVSAWFYAPVAGRVAGKIGLQMGIDGNTNFFDANTTQLDSGSVPLVVGWQQIVMRVQVPAGKVVGRLVANIQKVNAAGTVAVGQIDDVSMRLIDMSPATTDLQMAAGTALKFTPPVGDASIYASTAAGREYLVLFSEGTYMQLYGASDSLYPSQIQLNPAGGGAELQVMPGVVNMLGDPQYNGLSMPRGNIAGQATTADNAVNSSSATYVDILGPPSALVITFTAILGRRYRIYATGTVRSSTVGVGMGVAIRDSANVIQGQAYITTMGSVASRPTSYAFWVDVTPTAGSKTYKLSFNLAGGTGAVIHGPATFAIDDVGLV